MSGQPPPNPFKGVEPFRSGDALFGRDTDLLLVKDRVFRTRTTLLFAGSGVGKTSFFQAKFIPDLDQIYGDHFCTCYHGTWSGRNPLAALKKSLGAPGGESLRDFFRRPTDPPDRTWVVVLDQFEELFQYHVHLEYFDAFRDELCEAINDTSAPVRFVFAMREEFLGQLSAFDNRVPDLFANYFRLKNPDRRQTEEIIELTCEDAGVNVDPAGLAALIADLSSLELRTSGRRTRRLQRDFVVLPHLQIVCQGLWNEAPSDGKKAESAFLAGYAAAAGRHRRSPAGKILEAYCSSRLDSLSPEQQAIAARALDYLVTTQGAKMAYELKSLARHMAVDEAALEATLGTLSGNVRILRETQWQQERWFELYHDMYAPVLYEWKAHFEQEAIGRRAHETRAAVCDQRAVHAEARENLDEALLQRLRALEICHTDERARQAARLLRGVGALQMTFRHDGPIVALAVDQAAYRVHIAFTPAAPSTLDPSAPSTPELTLVQAWNSTNGEPVGKPVELSGAVRAFAYNRHATLLAAVVGRRVHFVDPGGKTVTHLIPVPKRLPTESFRIRFADDHETALVEIRGGNLTWAAVPYKGSARAPSQRRFMRLAFDPSGKYVAGAIGQKILLFEARSPLTPVHTLPVRADVTAIAFSPDGKLLAAGTRDGELSRWNTADASRLPEVFSESGIVRRLAFAGQSLLRAVYVTRGTSSEKGVLRTWDLRTGKIVGEPILLRAGRTLVPEFSPGGNFASPRPPGAGDVSIRDLRSGALLERPWLREFRSKIDWSAGEEVVLSGGNAGIARLWQPSELSPMMPGFTHSAGFVSTVLDPEGERIALVTGDGELSIRSIEGKVLRVLAGEIVTACWDQRGKMIAAAQRDGVVRVFNASSGAEQWQAKAPGVQEVFFIPSGDALVLKVDWDKFRWCKAGAAPRRSRRGHYCAFSRTGRIFVLQVLDTSAISICDAASGDEVARVHHKGGTNSVAVSPNGKMLLTAGVDGRALLWRAPKWVPAGEIVHQGPVARAAFAAGSQFAATLGEDQIVRVFTVPQCDEVGRIQYAGNARDLEFTPDGLGLVILSNYWAHLFRIDGGLLPRASREIRGRYAGQFRFLNPAGSQMRVLTNTAYAEFATAVMNFDAVPDSIVKVPPVSEWEKRLGLRFEADEIVPAALARAPKAPKTVPTKKASPESDPL